jgi:teichuronic acid biosynthesis glycosyltransferase TuaG
MKYFEDNLISVIMPMYNSEDYIEESIQSIINQTYPLWELIIIDDKSKDKSVNIVDYYTKADARIKLVQLDINVGVAEARNRGIQLAKGRYIAFLDSDDLWLPEKLMLQLEFMRNHQAPMSYTQYCQFTDKVDRLGKLIDVEARIGYRELLKGNIIGCLTVMIDRTIVPEIHMSTQRHEDYIMWLSILKKGLYAYGLKKDLARYRKSSNSLSGNKFKSLHWTWNVYRKSEKLSFAKSFYCLCHYTLKGLRKHF